MKLFQARTMSNNRSLTIVNIWHCHVNLKSSFPISLIRFSRDCLLTHWVNLMHLFDSRSKNLVICLRISFLSVQCPQCFNKYSEKEKGYWKFVTQDGINPPRFCLIRLFVLHLYLHWHCLALGLLEFGNMHIVIPLGRSVSISSPSHGNEWQPWMPLQKPTQR